MNLAKQKYKQKRADMKKKKNIILLLFFGFLITQRLTAGYTYNYPDSFIFFRNTVYMQNNSSSESRLLYTSVKQDIEQSFFGAEKYLLLARCENLMGIALRSENKKNEAASFFEQGIIWAQESISILPTSEGYWLLGLNISFLCEMKTVYALANYKKIEENARKALDLDPGNLMAKHLIAAFYICAPWPVSDIRKGMSLLEEILQQNYSSLDWEDQFNLFLILHVACLKLKRNQEAEIWRAGCEAIYPTNNFIKLLL